TRYRSYTFQFIALLLVVALIAYLGSNLVQNLRAAGLNISYEFLGEPAGYDINQRPIPYDSQSTHMRASIVGVLNTLIVAFLACLTATIIGVIAGVLRLSNNWLVRKLMAVYVEAFRNVPVLIWILIIFTIMTATLPAPRAFRGEDPEASMLFGAVAFTNRGVYLPKPLFEPMGWVVLGIFVLSIIGAIWYRRYATKLLYDTGRLLPMGWPTAAIVILPAVLFYFILGRPIALEYPELGGFNFSGGVQVLGSLIALWLALAIYTGAFIAENVRAGIQAVSRGQTEAAASLGLRPRRIMNLVVLPQALRIIIPPLISQYLNITKNSSLAIAVGYMDITGTLGGITLNQTGRAIEAVLLLMLFYLTISLIISAVMNVYNNAVKLKER
ncbi:amino acid ABC transporter permease, partial [Cribrihabitans sp. XS_ASV171]